VTLLSVLTSELPNAKGIALRVLNFVSVSARILARLFKILCVFFFTAEVKEFFEEFLEVKFYRFRVNEFASQSISLPESRVGG
jgi:hypothetical protein